MLHRLVCQNYRTLKEFTVELSPLTVLVGPNGAGKSTVIDAIDFLLGERWPSIGNLAVPGDFTGLDHSQSLLVQAWFEPSLTYEDAKRDTHEIGAIEFRCQPYVRRTGNRVPGDLRDMYHPLSPDGQPVTVCTSPPRQGSKPTFAPLTTVNSGLREQAKVLTIKESRTVAGQLPGRRGSILAKLLSEARGSYLRNDAGERTSFSEQYARAVDALRTDAVREVEGTVQDTARQMLGFQGASSDLSIEFGFADPANPYSALRLMCRQQGMLLPAEALGAGEQSAIVVGLFEAFRRIGTSLETILVEEPEMYLHPQAQRYFKRLLQNLVDNRQAQIIMSTHSTTFADMTSFSSVRLLRKNSSGVSSVASVTQADDIAFLAEQIEREKLSQYIDAQTGEVVFANGVLLVEGHGDRLAAVTVAKQLSLDLDAEGLSILPCGGKSAIPFFAKLCRALNIPAVVLHDSDQYTGTDLAQWQQQENAKASVQNAAIRAAAGEGIAIFKVEPTLEASLGVGRNASDKPRRVLQAVQGSQLTDLPNALVEAVQALAGLRGSDSTVFAR